MAQYSRAFLTHVLGCVKALLTPARGRHSTRRRRSTRVRRYAPAPAPSPATTPAPSPDRASTKAHTPHLAPPATPPKPENIAFVRPYYLAHEREMARIQARANTRLRAWSTPAPIFTPVDPHTSADGFPTPPPPRIPAPRVPPRFEELPHLARIRQRQQQRHNRTATLTAPTTQAVEVGI